MCKKDDNPAFVKLGGAGTGIGLELELLHSDGSDSVDEFYADYTRYPLMKGYLGAIKEDGSVEGAEFVTHPATLAEHRKRLPELLEMAEFSDFYAENAASGLHVHVGREVFSKCGENVGLRRLLAYSIFGGTHWNDLQRRVMGRAGLEWAGAGLPGNDVPTDFSERLDLAAGWVTAWKCVKCTRINLCHRDTLEFRQGAASTQVHRVLGRVEFALGLCEYSLQPGLASRQVSGTPAGSGAPEAEVADFLRFLETQDYAAALALARS